MASRKPSNATLAIVEKLRRRAAELTASNLRLRRVTHQMLAAREKERMKVSRELQDEIAQALLGIHVRLSSLKREARRRTNGLREEIARAQKLVVESARSAARVTRRFRSA